MDDRMAPLADLIVLDLTQFAAGPYCTMLLADAGARVIKIEPPTRGEAYRSMGPRLTGSGDTSVGGYFLRFNRNKQSLTLDLRTESGRQVFRRLVARADVVVENFNAHAMARFGLSYESLRAINPRLVYASISGFGHTDIYQSPYADRPAFAIVPEAMAGIMDRIGAPTCEPHWSGVSLGDLYPSLLALAGILIALHHRGQTGQGQHVDIAMYDGMLSLNERAVFTYLATGADPGRGVEPEFAPFGAFPTKNGYVAIGVLGDSHWQRLCAAIDRTDLATDSRVQSGVDRARNLDELIRPTLVTWLKDKTKEEAVELLIAHDVPAAPLQSLPDIVDCPHVQARELLVEVDYPGLPRYRTVGTPIKLSADSAMKVGRVPLLGEHTESILREFLGLDSTDLQALRAEGAI